MGLWVCVYIQLLSMARYLGNTPSNNINVSCLINFFCLEPGNATIVSPNYPDNYPNNVNTQWLVSGPADYQIMAVFSTFDLEYNYDFLRVGSGLDPDDTASLLATLSGSSLPDNIVSSSNEMWLVFTSDGSNTELGFRMSIEVYIPGNYTGN